MDEDEVVMVEDVEDEEPRELDTDFNYESQPEESSDDYEEDDEAKAWLQAHPSGTLPLPSPPKHRYSEGEWRGPEKVGLAGRRRRARWGSGTGRPRALGRRSVGAAAVPAPVLADGCCLPCFLAGPPPVSLGSSRAF